MKLRLFYIGFAAVLFTYATVDGIEKYMRQQLREQERQVNFAIWKMDTQYCYDDRVLNNGVSGAAVVCYGPSEQKQ